MAQSSSPQSPDPPDTGGSGKGHLPRVLTWSGLAKGLGAIALAVVPVVGLYVFSPWYQEHVDPPSKSVSLGAVCIESGVTRESFWSRYEVYNITDSTMQGLMVSVALTANGFDGHDIYIRSDVLNAVSGAEALGARQELGNLRPLPLNAATVMRDPQVWVPLPATAGQYEVQIRVYDGDSPAGNQGLASAYSSVFSLDQRGRVSLSDLCTSPNPSLSPLGIVFRDQKSLIQKISW